uniref:EGF-like domain-containing protein n=1 Tax=Strongyloides papillosus TaxID=174720 RepID=A0A0N5B604_STREA
MSGVSLVDQFDSEQYHIANSGINGTCKYNPCKNGGLCFYTALLDDYFCQCNTCHSGPYCDIQSCNSDDVNLNYYRNLKITRLNESSYYIVAFILFIFILAFWRSTKVHKNFETSAKYSKNEKFEEEFCFRDQEPISNKLINY